MIRVAEHVARTDTGRQRATNEDSHLERTPVSVRATCSATRIIGSPRS